MIQRIFDKYMFTAYLALLSHVDIKTKIRVFVSSQHNVSALSYQKSVTVGFSIDTEPRTGDLKSVQVHRIFVAFFILVGILSHQGSCKDKFRKVFPWFSLR